MSKEAEGLWYKRFGVTTTAMRYPVKTTRAKPPKICGINQEAMQPLPALQTRSVDRSKICPHCTLWSAVDTGPRCRRRGRCFRSHDCRSIGWNRIQYKISSAKFNIANEPEELIQHSILGKFQHPQSCAVMFDGGIDRQRFIERSEHMRKPRIAICTSGFSAGMPSRSFLK